MNSRFSQAPKESKWYQENKNTPAFKKARELILGLSTTPTLQTIEKAFNLFKDSELSTVDDANSLRALIEIGMTHYNLDSAKKDQMFSDYKFRVADIRENECQRAFSSGEYHEDYENYKKECNLTKAKVIALLETEEKDSNWIKKAKQARAHSASLGSRIVQLKGNQETKAECVLTYHALKAITERLQEVITNATLDNEKAT